MSNPLCKHHLRSIYISNKKVKKLIKKSKYERKVRKELVKANKVKKVIKKSKCERKVRKELVKRELHQPIAIDNWDNAMKNFFDYQMGFP